MGSVGSACVDLPMRLQAQGLGMVWHALTVAAGTAGEAALRHLLFGGAPALVELAARAGREPLDFLTELLCRTLQTQREELQGAASVTLTEPTPVVGYASGRGQPRRRRQRDGQQ